MPKPITIEYDGRSQSVSAWARETGLSISLLLSRLRHGWPASEILTTPINERRDSKPPARTYLILEHGGKKQSLAAWSQETGLSRSVIQGRLGLGWSVADALTKLNRGRKPNGTGYKRKNMRAYRVPHKRPGYRPKPDDGCCECCHQKCANLHGDHDKLTERFRGWICFHCNTGIGKLGDNIEGLRDAIAYLERVTTE